MPWVAGQAARFTMPFYPTSPYLLPIFLLLCSNLFMTIA